MNEIKLKVAGVVFLIIAVLQLMRFLVRLEVVAGGIHVPVWISAVAAFVFFALAVWILKPLCCKR